MYLCVMYMYLCIMYMYLCIMYMYLCVRAIDFASFYDFSIVF